MSYKSSSNRGQIRDAINSICTKSTNKITVNFVLVNVSRQPRLLAYFSSLGGPLPYEWAKITTNGNITNAPVPLNPGEVYVPGSINSIAQVLNEDGDYGTFNFLFCFYKQKIPF